MKVSEIFSTGGGCRGGGYEDHDRHYSYGGYEHHYYHRDYYYRSYYHYHDYDRHNGGGLINIRL